MPTWIPAVSPFEHPPVIEVICVVYFKPAGQWVGIEPGLFYSTITEQFPKWRFNSSSKPEPFQELLLSFDPGSVTNVFATEDQLTYLGVGPGIVSINQLGNYRGIDPMISMADEMAKHYATLFTNREVLGVQLKYVNTVTVPETIPKLSDYFTFYPHASEVIRHPLVKFRVSAHSMLPSEDAFIRLECYDDPLDDRGFQTYRLFVSAVSFWEHAHDVADVSSWLRSTHPSIVEAFYAALTDKTLELYRLKGR
jgi:uncharacterized protein (TIGR04255 family)